MSEEIREPSPELLRRVGLAHADLTEAEIAELEGVSVRTVQGWRVRGCGPPFRKLGQGKSAHVRYPVEEYQEWRRQSVIRHTAQAR